MTWTEADIYGQNSCNNFVQDTKGINTSLERKENPG
jgi:hypothetical protein